MLFTRPLQYIDLAHLMPIKNTILVKGYKIKSQTDECMATEYNSLAGWNMKTLDTIDVALKHMQE